MTPGSVHTTLPSSNSKFQDKTVSNFPDDGQGPADIHGLADGTLMDPGHNGGQVPVLVCFKFTCMFVLPRKY